MDATAGCGGSKCDLTLGCGGCGGGGGVMVAEARGTWPSGEVVDTTFAVIKVGAKAADANNANGSLHVILSAAVAFLLFWVGGVGMSHCDCNVCGCLRDMKFGYGCSYDGRISFSGNDLTFDVLLFWQYRL